MAISYNPSIVVSGLSFCSDAANIKCYNSATSATNWSDLTSTVGVGSLTNGATFNTSNLGNITFDGTNDYISVPNTLNLNPETGSFSIVVWVNSDPSNGGDGWDMWVAKRVNSTNGYCIGANSVNGVRFGMGNDQSTFVNTGYISYTANTWAMFTGILNVNNNTQTVIRNNNEQSVSTTPAGGTYSNSAILSIGGDFGVNSFYVNGKVAHVAIYNKALTSAEISQNFNALKGRFGL
jgi:hypothetical protein